MAKILITGGAGYIGSTLVPMLLGRGHEVTVLDNFMFQQTPFLDWCWNDKLRVVRGDVRQTKLLQELVPHHDVIIPLAALVGAPLCDRDPVAAQAINADAVKALYDLKSKDQILIYPCTNSGYGIGQADSFCDEDSPLKPISIYGRVKVEAESYLLDKGEAITFRLATVFGASPRMRLDLLVNDFTYRAVTDRFIVLFEAHFKRNYLHVRDAARAFIHAMDNYSTMKGRAYNVGLSDANLSKAELCERIQKYVPQFRVFLSEIGEDPDKRDYIVSNKRIESTGYRTEHSLDFGIQELLKAFQIMRRSQFANI
jgi:nucleoside-diphosphate-sugar epimerase